MDEFLGRLLWGQLQAMGLFITAHSSGHLETQVETEVSITNFRKILHSSYERWFNQSLEFFVQQHYLTFDGKSYLVVNSSPTDVNRLWVEWDLQKNKWLENPNRKAQVILAETTLRALPDILTGKVPATDIIFPNSSMALVEGIYKNSLVVDYFNEVLANTVVSYIQELLKHDPEQTQTIRIIEIGAGTGGTSTVVFEKLKPYQAQIQEYCYTDLSKAFLIHAEKEYGPQNPYLTYRIFNAEKPLIEQGINIGGYDIVIAANVLHATKNIRQTMRNVKATLKKNGLILLNEISQNSLFTHLTFGLLEGWWRYEDSNLRIPGCPGLYSETWQTILEAEGFQSVFFPAQDGHYLGQQIIVAESDGIIRQKQSNHHHSSFEATSITVNKKTDPSKIPSVQSIKKNNTLSISQAWNEGNITELLREKSIVYFKKIIGETLKIPYSKIDPSEPLETYGIDSILVVQLNNVLRKTFDNISSTLFFEYQTISELVEHFLQTEAATLQKLLRLDTLPETSFSEPERMGLESSLEIPKPVNKGNRFRQPHRPEAKPEKQSQEPIAIIGLSGRYPQARNVNEYWDNLSNGRDNITEIPVGRWPMEGFYHPNPNEAIALGKSYCKWGGFIEGFAEFDPLFFNISPLEAINMDPQERLFIQSCWEVFEDAGYTREQLLSQCHGKIGVFAGITRTGFDLYGPDLWRQGEKIYPHTSFGSVANRVSYLMNLQGPSMPIDTMCSSSLIAIHEACEHLSRRDCEMAIAGGVNLYLHPTSYYGLSGQRMLSIDGRCKSFGLGGNGFVPGEGVGAVLLKRLSRAIADQDHIYAVIRGSSINHGGKTNGYTVPNPLAQATVIRAALDKSGVNARTVSYIEAHGTGTELGDPIEITGLTQAFHKDTSETGFCAIGSVKSNIGHLEAAAGIAGLTKIILQMKHGQFVPSLHARELNPNIDFSKTPFVVQQTLMEWKRPLIEEQGMIKEYPRIAGISSFGAGGANAHVIIEEYVPKKTDSRTTYQLGTVLQGQFIIVLSAKSEEQLEKQVQRLLASIQTESFSSQDLTDIAYTLQIGRESMDVRLGLLVKSLSELKHKLQNFLDGQEGIDELYYGKSKRDQDSFGVFSADEDLQKAIDAWITKKKYGKIVDLWVKGLAFDWNKLYPEGKPQRISLPTYPFSEETYWIPKIYANLNSVVTGEIQSLEQIHPLLHRNTSDFTEQRFSSIFTGQEFFLAAHVVQGQRFLPGVAYLEMARAAVESASGLISGVIEPDHPGVQLKNVVWIRPIMVGKEPLSIHIGLYPDQNGEINYEIYSLPRNPGISAQEIEPLVYCQGKATLNPISGGSTLDINYIQAQCEQRMLSAEECYHAFKTMGIDYGPAHRGIEKVYIGQGQVLAKLNLPDSVFDTLDQFILHPSILDSALQASIGLGMGTNNSIPAESPQRPSLPFSLEGLEVLGHCTRNMWALIQVSNSNQAIHNMTEPNRIQKLDIELCDEQGNIQVRMKGFVARELIQELTSNQDLNVVSANPVPSIVGNLILASVWDMFQIENKPISPTRTERLIMIGGTKKEQQIIRQFDPLVQSMTIKPDDTIEQIAEKLQAQGDIRHILWVAPAYSLPTLANESLITEENRGVLQVFRVVKALLKLNYGVKDLSWTFITFRTQAICKNECIDPTHSSLIGLIGALAKEYNNWKIRFCDLETMKDKEWPIRDIFTLPTDPNGDPFVYRSGEWYRQKLIPVQGTVERSLNQDRNLYRTGGVYVVIGGAGGIGEAWTEHLIRTYQAQIVWLGRKPIDAVIQAKIDRMAAFGKTPQYITADAADPNALEEAYRRIKIEHSQIHGVVHSAIVLLDQSLGNMDEARFRAGLAAKVDVCVRVAQVFQKEALDFVLFFSAMQSFIKAPGQSNYAAGCTFVDAFAHQLALEWACPVKVMNWGYWGSVGIVASKAYQERMAQLGFGSIEPLEGMAALDDLLTSSIDQMVFVKTTKPLDRLSQVGESLTIYPAEFPSNTQNIIQHISIPTQLLNIFNESQSNEHVLDCSPLTEKIQSILIQQAAKLLHVEPEEIDPGTDLCEYGVDPVKFTELITQLNQQFQLELKASLFSNYQTLDGLTDYIVNTCKEVLVKRFSVEMSNSPEKSTTSSSTNEMNELLHSLLWVQLKSAGLLTKSKFELSQVKNGVTPLYSRWLIESLAFLTRNNYLTHDGQTYSLNVPASMDSKLIWEQWEQNKKGWLSDPNLKAQVILVETTLRALPEIITGKKTATDVMFPNSSLELVEGIYRNNLAVEAFNEMVAEIIAANIRERQKQNSSAAIRIIEIGAGTGGTSTVVFRRLRPYRAQIKEYCYTDISKSFLLRAESEFGPENPYLTYQIFNVEETVAGQGIDVGEYDIAIATNVLHATKNIRQTIRNVKATLKNNGLLILNEMSHNSLLVHLTFGLLEGWWRYEDAQLRIPGCPGLYPKAWQGILKEEGFHSVYFPAQKVHELGQQIIIAESDGVVRQNQTVASSTKSSIVMNGRKETVSIALSETLKKEAGVKQNPPPISRGEISTEQLREKSTFYLKKLIGETLKIPYHKIDANEPFEKYGIDSILVVQLTNVLSKVFENINSTLFFEYQTIDALVTYLLKMQKDVFLKLIGWENSTDSLETSEIHKESKQLATLPSIPVFRQSRHFFQYPNFETKPNPQTSKVPDIAIVGLAGRYAKADNIQEFWSNLKEGRNCISEIPKDRWNWQEYYHQEKGKEGTIYTKWGGFIQDIDKFDPLFFHITPKEAEQMDPQERLFMEVAYSGIEDAGYTPANLCESRKIGVFVGVMNANYPAGASYWSIANRISYLLNFQGPSIAVDTACSSSLTAVHLALESLYSGISECAIAGGVNLIVNPSHYLRLTGMTMLSSGNECKSFGDGADGFVDGEGVGVIVLKPLVKAVADGDHIYGIIKGSMLNAGGKTNGYTVPNPNAQAQLIADCLKRAGVDARSISYLEAHGTGTALGDPIEIAGLTHAFTLDSQDKQFCAIGSAKSNIGHCESAAGIAGITKVLLQMKHQQLVPSLHSTKLNPNIDFQNSPFVVQQQLTEWKQPEVEVNGRLTQFPRRAGISSFGAGGSNAHVIIEEYIPHSQGGSIPVNAQNPAIIILSAKNDTRLKEQAQQLLTALQTQSFTDTNLADIAYTLQVGREAMEERLAMLVSSIDDLQEKLQGFIERQDNTELYRGQIKVHKETMQFFTSDEELQEAVAKWIQRCKYEKLLELWVKGLHFDWNRLYVENKPRRLSLPTYPFAKEHYWMNRKELKPGLNNLLPTTLLHPLLHQNTSNFKEQRYSSTFTGQEYFLRDHVVKGQRILPELAYLEIVRAGLEQSSGIDCLSKVCFKNIVWADPIVIGEAPVRVQTELYPQENDEIAFEIYHDSEIDETIPIIHSQGYARLIEDKASPVIDITAIQAHCSQRVVSSAEIYQKLKSYGIECGLGQRGVEEIYVGSGQAIVKLVLASTFPDTQGQFGIHPSLLEATWQSWSCLMIEVESAGNKTPAITSPYTLREFTMFKACPSKVWAWIRTDSGVTTEGYLPVIDMDICDEHGNVCVQMKGLRRRILGNEFISAEPTNHGILMLAQNWNEFVKTDEVRSTHEYEQHLIYLIELENIQPESIEAQMPGVHCLSLQTKQQNIAERFQSIAGQIFEAIRQIIKTKPKQTVLMQVVIPSSKEGQLFAGLEGLLKTAQLENPKFIGELIEIESGEDSTIIINQLQANLRNPVGSRVRYQDSHYGVAGWQEMNIATTGKLPWKDGGIYLITGGAGGLGQIFANEIAEQVKNARIILTGRSLLSGEEQSKLKVFEKNRARVKYQSVNVTNKKDVTDLIQGIREEFGGLHGIIHSAGIIRDNYILRKTTQEMQDVMAPKVTGLINLDEATKDLNLDFFIFFSSLSGSFGNPGQADYSTANGFMDAYAEYRNYLVSLNQRYGRTLAIGWPLWKEGGMQVTHTAEKLMEQNAGMAAMQTHSGLQAFYQAFSSEKNNVLVIEGDLVKLKAQFLSGMPKAQLLGVKSVPNENMDRILEKTLYQLKVLFGDVTGLEITRIDSDEPLESYGIDSVMILQLNPKLEAIFGELSKTLFYEYQTLGELAEYLTTEYTQACQKWTGLEKSVSREIQPPAEATHRLNTQYSVLTSFKMKPQRLWSRNISSGQEIWEPIAIIGMSGRYPGANNLHEYWCNLAAGKDSICEIPAERWPLEGFYHRNPQEAIAQGKSYSKWGGFINGFNEFDPLFFNISPRETINIDPQERLFIQACWEVLEDAGYTKEQITEKYQGRVGVFAGITKTGFDLYGPELWKQGEHIYPYTSFSSVANRVSYLFNFQGPSMPIDTMCSSSLTAIHEACEYLHRGECDMAMAGGVNLYLHPSGYIALCSQQMLSQDGQCKSFGLGGNGFVPGEGVGVVLLKRLSQAIIDQDQIYAVIRGTGINHGGKTNGYTVPNPKAQGELVRTTLEKAEVNARIVSYIEAHGTGTELGDPIEITGLTQAFRKDTQDKGYCAIGSVKSNIGHLEAAAGIAGLTKIVLQMQHQKITPSLHAQELNPNINFSQTPFVVQQELGEWRRPLIEMNGVIQEYPRIAGISSFGAGGSNAHVIIEEYLPQEVQIKNKQSKLESVAILLSAKNEDRLKEQAFQLLTTVRERPFTNEDLADIAYTLQIGREAMEERLGMVISSIQELTAKLQGFLDGQVNIPDLYRGQSIENNETLHLFTIDEELQEAVNKWIQYKKYGKLLNLWVKGLVIDWNKLYAEFKPHRISLPTYPFAKEKYWIPKLDQEKMVTALPAMLHPLLHQNTSDLREQRYSSKFAGTEFFMADYWNQIALSWAAYLEMARAAVKAASGELDTNNTQISLKDIAWSKSFTIGDNPTQLHIGLFPEENGEIAYEIYSSSDNTQLILHNQGRAVLVPTAIIPNIDLRVILAKCNHKAFTAIEIYSALQQLGLNYGLGYRAIETLQIGEDQAIAKLSLPLVVAETRHQFELHPSIIESSFQAVIVFMMSITSNPLFIVTLQELEIFGSCTENMWAVIRNCEKRFGEEDWILDIDLCDETGTICMRLKGLKMKETANFQAPSIVEMQKMAFSQHENVPSIQEASELLTFEESWQEETLEPVSAVQPHTILCFVTNPENRQIIKETIRNHDSETELIFIAQNAIYLKQNQGEYYISKANQNSYQEAFQSIQQNYQEIDAILYLWPLEDTSCIEDHSIIFYLMQAMAAVKLKVKRILFGAQFSNGLQQSYLESWIGFERSLELVLPYTQVATIIQAAQELNQETLTDWVNKLWNELHTSRIKSVLYQSGKRYTSQIWQIDISSESSQTPIKAGGTYLITGGCGGLGLLFAEHLAKNSTPTEPVHLILTGRSPLEADIQSKIKVLEKLGSQVHYIQADLSNQTRMKKGLSQAKERFGAIHGVIHAAGVAGGQIIFTKELTQFQAVLNPKIKGTIVLDELLKNESLDFICYFSSAAAILGDFGSCDYAVANRFLMAYARYRNQQGKNSGKVVVINWPLWKEGGMGFKDDENYKMYLKSSGQSVLEAEEGLGLFDRIISRCMGPKTLTQYLIISGQPSRIKRFLGITKVESSTLKPVVKDTSKSLPIQGQGRCPELKGLSIEQCVEWDLKEQISRLMLISRDKIDRRGNLADFGFDSISLSELASRLSKYYGLEITPALFFGHSTITKLTEYFVTEQKEVIWKFYKDEVETTKPVKPIDLSMIPVVMNQLKPRPREFRFGLGNAAPSIAEPIAIIGMSGRFPGARNIDELWKVLSTGQDMVKEIPLDRFDWHPYYTNSNEPGKTNCKWCGCIDGVSEFEPLFFEISPKEAETMDPRQRLLLQEAWKALENAGYGAAQIKTQKIGMFVGVEQGDYQLITQGDGEVTSNSNAILASRLAYFLNLNGPVMAIDTACSSGLVAAHQAILSLRNGECDTAIVAGVNLLLTPAAFIGMSQAGMLSEHGKCFTFDKRANGLVPGEAVAVIILKRLTKAEADRVPIDAIIKGSGINYDGKTNGITAPSGVSQTALMKEIYEHFHINPEDIDYIITHGTATKLGDSVEITALYDAFKSYTQKKGYCALTSTKTNFGHTFAPSGLVSLISMVLALYHETIPASLHCEQENDYINWKGSPFYVNKTNQPWLANKRSRTGAVSAFGMSGTNAHLVVQSYSGNNSKILQDQAPYYLLVFSAKTAEALAEKINDMVEVLQNNERYHYELSQISFTLLEGRQHFQYRIAFVVQDHQNALYVLKQNGKEMLPNGFQRLVSHNFTETKALAQYGQELLNSSLSARSNPPKYREMLFALADLYCQGYEFDWKQLFNPNMQRIHLPSYPFAKEHYWIQDNKIQVAATSLPQQRNALLYEQLLDEILDNKTSIHQAVIKTKKIIMG